MTFRRGFAVAAAFCLITFALGCDVPIVDVTADPGPPECGIGIEGGPGTSFELQYDGTGTCLVSVVEDGELSIVGSGLKDGDTFAGVEAGDVVLVACESGCVASIKVVD